MQRERSFQPSCSQPSPAAGNVVRICRLLPRRAQSGLRLAHNRAGQRLLQMCHFGASRSAVVFKVHAAAGGAAEAEEEPEEKLPKVEAPERPTGGFGTESTLPSTSDSAEVKEDWRAFRAKLVAQEYAVAQGQAPAVAPSSPGRPKRKGRKKQSVSGSAASGRQRWAHPLARPEPGCLLVARRSDLGFFHQCVVLLLSHDDREGSVGLVLNKPVGLTLSDLGIRSPDIDDAFCGEQLFLGGPMSVDTLHCLHGHPGLEEAARIVEGVYTGGLADAIHRINAGEPPASDFRLLAGFSAWGAYQLSREMLDSYWWIVAASEGFILDTVEGNVGVPGDRVATQEAVWQEVLGLAGIDARQIICEEETF